MNLKKKLTNPFLLVAQGFAAGAIFFFAVAQPLKADAPQVSEASRSAPAAENLEA